MKKESDRGEEERRTVRMMTRLVQGFRRKQCQICGGALQKESTEDKEEALGCMYTDLPEARSSNKKAIAFRTFQRVRIRIDELLFEQLKIRPVRKQKRRPGWRTTRETIQRMQGKKASFPLCSFFGRVPRLKSCLHGERERGMLGEALLRTSIPRSRLHMGLLLRASFDGFPVSYQLPKRDIK